MLLRSTQSSAPIRVSILIGLVILIGYKIFLATQNFLTTSPTIPTVSYCELVRNPMRYDQTTVRVSSIHIVGFEWSYLMDDECLEQTWAILTPENPECSVDMPTPSTPVDWRGGMRAVTVTGKFYGERGGYGHLGQYPYMFEVICIERASSLIPWIIP